MHIPVINIFRRMTGAEWCDGDFIASLEWCYIPMVSEITVNKGNMKAPHHLPFVRVWAGACPAAVSVARAGAVFGKLTHISWAYNDIGINSLLLPGSPPRQLLPQLPYELPTPLLQSSPPPPPPPPPPPSAQLLPPQLLQPLPHSPQPAVSAIPVVSQTSQQELLT